MKETLEQLEISEAEQQTIIASIEQKKLSEEHLEERGKELSVLDKERLEELAKQNERKDNLYQDIVNFTADSEKYSISLEQIQAHKKNLKSSC